MTIFYFCFDHEKRLGGVKQIYRHVELLRAAGENAFVVHERRRKALDWFEHRARVLTQAEFGRRFRDTRDVVVLPEDMVTLPRGARALALSSRVVIFNQNAYLGFTGLGAAVPQPYPYLHPSVIGVLAVSEHNARLLRYAFPRSKVLRVQYGVDARRFRFRPLAKKSPLIVCALKAQSHVELFFHVMRARQAQRRNALEGFTWVPLAGFTEEETAGLLEEAAALVFLNTDEGFGILPVEAQLCGAAVLAPFTGPMAEFLTPRTRHLPGDWVALGRTLERVALHVRGHADPALQGACNDARRRALGFSLAAERKSVLAAWRILLG